MKFYDYFDKIIYINLDKRTDRKTQLEQEFIRLNIPDSKIQRFPAIEDKFGAIGCTMSHIAVLKIAKDNNLSSVLILEDDFNFNQIPEYIEQLFHDFFTNFQNWEAIHLSRGGMFHVKDTKFKHIKKINYVTASSGYIVNNSFYDKLINNFEESLKLLTNTKRSCNYALDVYWKNLQSSSNWYVFHPSLGYQRASHSDIDNRWCPHSYDKSIHTNYVTFNLSNTDSLKDKIIYTYCFGLKYTKIPIFKKSSLPNNPIFSSINILDDDVFNKLNFTKCNSNSNLPNNQHIILEDMENPILSDYTYMISIISNKLSNYF